MGADTQQNDDFDAAFDQAVAGPHPEADSSAAEEEETSEGVEGEEEAVETDEGEAGGEETVEQDDAVVDDDSEGEAGGEEEEGGGEEQSAEPQQRQYTDDELAQIAERIQQRRSGSEAEGSEEETGGQEEEQQPTNWMDYVPEDKRQLVEQYESEWPEVAEAEQLKREAQLKQLQDQVYSEVGQALAPIADMHRQMQVDAHHKAIQAKHSDVDDIKDDLIEWVGQQPDFVRPAFEQVLQKGSAEEVNQLIDHYKQATGSATGAGAGTTASSARQQQGSGNVTKRSSKKAAPSASAKNATAAAPKPKRTEPPKATDPTDFDSAFDEAAGLK